MTDDLESIIAGTQSLEGFDFDALELGPENIGDRAAKRQASTEDKPKKLAGEAAGIGLRNRVVTKTPARRFYDLRQIPHAVDLIQPLPAPGETVHAMMGGDFAAWDLVPAILSLTGKPAVAFYAATLGFNAQNNDHLCELMQAGKIQKAVVLCSDYFAKSDAKTFAEAQAALRPLGGILASTRNHAKILALDFGAEAFVVESSANLRSCNNLEQLALSNSKALFDFHAGWIGSIAHA